MKFKQFIIIPLLLLILQPAFGQPGQDRRERIEALKTAYITRQLDLSTEEARVFWPVYDEYQAEMRSIKKERIMEKADTRLNFDEMTDQEAEAKLNAMLDGKQAEIDLNRRYIKEFKKVLPVKKVARLYHAEHRFKMDLLREMKENRQGNYPDRGLRGQQRRNGGRF